MATQLHQVATLTRKIFLFGIIGIFALIVLSFLWNAIKQQFFPTPPPTPTVLFGTLPRVNFPQQEKPTFSFSIDTVEGTLPPFPDQTKVYRLEMRQPSLVALGESRKTVGQLGFTRDETPETATRYRWEDPIVPGRKISFDIVSKNFDMTSDFYHDRDVLLARHLPRNDEAASLAESFLSRIERLPEDVDRQRTIVSFFTIEGTSLIETSSLASAKVVRVDLFRKTADNVPIVHQKMSKSPITFLVGSKSESDSEVVEAHVAYQSIDPDDFSTYPLKTIDAAFQNLQDGNAYIASSLDETKQDISIQNVTLAYYLGSAQEKYLMPVFIFEGENDFIAYVSAIDDAWIEK